MAKKRTDEEERKRLYGNVNKNSKQMAAYSEKALSSLAKGTYSQDRASSLDEYNKNRVPSLKKTESNASASKASDTPSVSENKTGVPSVKPSTKYSNQSATTSAPTQSTRDKSFDKDFDNFYEWRYNKADSTDYDPNTDTNVAHWEAVKKEIMSKNNWTEDEFNRRWGEYDKERSQNIANKEVETAIGVAKEHPILGTVLQAIQTPRTWVEGATTAIQGLVNNFAPNSKDAKEHTSESATDPKLTGTRIKEGIKQTVKDEHINSNFGKTIYDVGTGLGDMAMSASVPTVGPVSSGLATGASNQMHALERGADANTAARYGGLSGTVSAIMNTIGLDKALNMPAKTAWQAVGKAAATEGLENIVEDTANLIADSAFNKNNSQFASLKEYYKGQDASDEEAEKQARNDILKDLVMSGVTSAAFGGLMNGVRNGDELIGETAQKLIYNRKNNADIQNIIDGKAPANADVQNTVEPTAESNEAPVTKEEIDNLRQDLNVSKNVNTVSEPTTNAKPQIDANASSDDIAAMDIAENRAKSEVKPLEGEELTTAQNRVKEINKEVRDNNKVIKTYEEAKKSAKNKTEKQKIQKQIDELKAKNTSIQSERTTLNRQIDGKPTPTIELLPEETSAGVNSVKKRISDMSNMFAGEEGKQIKTEAIKALDNYVETGDMDSFQTLADNVVKLDALCQGKSYTSKNGNVSTYDEYGSIVDWTLGDKSLSDVYDYHAQKGIYLTDEEVANLQKDMNIPEEPNNVPNVQNTEVNQNNGTVATPTQNNANLGQNQSVPRVDNVEQSTDPNIGKSNVVYNSAINADIVTKDEIDASPELQKIAEYVKHSNAETYDAARMNVEKNSKQLLKEYSDGSRAIDSDQSVDEAMILLTSLSDKLKRANSEKSIAKITAQRNKLLSQLRKAGTEAGQEIQAFAKWNLTADGALINGDRIVEERVNNWKRSNKSSVEENKRIAQAMKDIGYDGTMDVGSKAPLTHEQVKQGVIKAIEKEHGSIEGKFSDNHIEFLTTLAEDKTVPVWVIQDELEHFFNHGEFYTLDESLPVLKKTSKTIDNILKGMGDDRRKAKNKKAPVEKTHSQTKEEIINSFSNEPTGIFGDFVDSDYEFIANMIEEKIPQWQIEDEVSHRLATGDWYTLDESLPEQSVGENTTFKQAVASLGREEIATPEAEEISFNDLKQQVRNTLGKESASLDIEKLSDADEARINEMRKKGASAEAIEAEINRIHESNVEYIAGMLENGASADEIADALDRKLATGTFGISNETQTIVNKLFEYARNYGTDSKNAVEARLAAYKLIADETVGKAEAFEKFEAWRYLAMLGNPKTMVRNFVGNVQTNIMTGFSNTLSAAIEGGVDKASRKMGGNGIERRKAVLNPIKDKGLIKSATNDADVSRYSEVSGTKYEKSVSDTIRRQKSTFDSKLVKLYEAITDAGISDYHFVKTKYGTSLAGYMKANGMDESAFDAEAKYKTLKAESNYRVLTDAEKNQMESLKSTMDKLEKGRDYALAQAEYATFHEDNVIADGITKLSQRWNNSDKVAARAAGKVIEGTVPFKKTPANVLRTGVEYSPLGAIKSIAETGKLIYENTGKRKSNLDETYMRKSLFGRQSEVTRTTASDVIQSWSQTATGSMMMALGAYLFDKGILNSSSDDEKYQDELEGKQNYSLTVNGETYTIDWMAPGSMPLLAGAAMKRIWDAAGGTSENFFKDIDSVVTSANELINPLIETSMMEGVQNILESAANEIKYNEGGAFGGILGAVVANTLSGYFTQAVPTLSGQIARTIDNTRRTSDTASDSAFVSGIEKQVRKVMNKIPGLSFLNTPYRDARGETQANNPSDNFLANLLYQMFSPSYIAGINVTKADKLSRDVYNSTAIDPETGEQVPIRDGDVFAKWKSKLTVNGEKVKPKELEKYRQVSGEANEKIRTMLADDEWFLGLNGTRQTEILKNVNTLVDKVGKDKLGYEQTGDAFEAYTTGGIPGLINYYKSTTTNKEITEATGLSASSNASKAIAEDMMNGNTTEAEQKSLAAVTLSGNFETPGPIYTYYNALEIDNTLTPEAFTDIYKKMDADGNEGIKQEEFLNYINKNNLSKDEIDTLWKIFKSGTTKKVPYLKDNGSWGLK